jgi:hypothetical protein
MAHGDMKLSILAQYPELQFLQPLMESSSVFRKESRALATKECVLYLQIAPGLVQLISGIFWKFQL